ncbi:quinone-dependent dihydroorotate dehydrogenase [Virgisporangium ochraceum]|uniref:Dihydroorotate dehydrogenase (quinone) n=1 Tax=Virgisporangium ochraceum TaxID=65505 RepID=A0A8J4EGS9_9ACTN|nr:quinone-dependent dihydroorotate dehydrogenase [Virgisporangium ochraceum]GIJ74199.1 dihydroorotate dehydrogenase (quinone) [Virgisporangium ochraceum]
MSLYGAARRVMFRLDAETAHERTLRALSAAAPVLRRRTAPARPTTVFGIRFPNPVGLAAGMDKNGVALRSWPALGFGFVEVGTVTLHAQPGNPRPRLFRLPVTGAIVNRMGFNNAGAAALAARLERLGPLPYPLGISLGKSKVTPLDGAVDDYVGSLDLVERHGDYFAVNVSSPNTPGLRSLQDRAFLGDLLRALRERTGKPLLVKVAPDLTDPALAELVEVAGEHRVDGIIATNTTVSRAGVAGSETALATAQEGGLSGPPVHDRVIQIVKFITSETTIPVIGVGGVDSPAAARRLADAGASLVQLYTGLVYRGPALVRACVKEWG